MPDTILYQVGQLTLTETKIKCGPTTASYASIGPSSIHEMRPLVALGVLGVLGVVVGCSATVWGAGALGPHLSLKMGVLVTAGSAALAVFGLRYKVLSLRLCIDARCITILKSKDRYPLEVAQRVIDTARRAYGTSAAATPAELRSDLNPL